MRKILFTATVDGHLQSFHIPYMKWFKEQGWVVHAASNGKTILPYCDYKYHLPTVRKPFNINNFYSFKKLNRIVEENNYDIIHCHTSIGAVIGRLAARKARKKGTKVIYTAHGFQFFKGGSLKRWLVFYNIERFLSRYTDILITINNEDYVAAQEFKLAKGSRVEYVPGVGVDLKRFVPQTAETKRQLRKQYNYCKNDFILFYAAELNYNKHQDLLINVVELLKDRIQEIKLLLAGNGNLKEQYEEQVKRLGLQDYIQFLGFRREIPDLLKISDVAVASSRREGLPVNVMEAMATGLPLVVTDVRGHRDLVKNGENGYIIGVNDVYGFADAIEKLYNDGKLKKKFGANGIQLVKKYSIENVIRRMESIYASIF